MELFNRSARTIKIISLFLTDSMADRLCTTVQAKSVNCTFITRFYVDDMLNHVNSIEVLPAQAAFDGYEYTTMSALRQSSVCSLKITVS